MQEHACSKGLTKECFSKYPTFFKRSLAYRSLYTLVPKTVIAVLKIGLERPLISPQATIPPNIEFPPGWVVFPDVDFPPAWNTADPPPPGVFPPPIFSPLLPESGASAPLFLMPSEGGPPSPPGGSLEPLPMDEVFQGSDGPGDSPLNIGDDIDWTRVSTRLIVSNNCNLTKSKFKIGKVGWPSDGVQVLVQGEQNGFRPDDTVLMGSSDTINGIDLPDFSIGQDFIDFIFPTQPLLTEGANYCSVILRTGAHDPTNYYQILAAGTSPGYVYHRDQNNVWLTAWIDLIEYEVYGISV